MRKRSVTLLVSCVLVVCACHDPASPGGSTATSFGTPVADPTTQSTGQTSSGGTPNWTADATVVSVASGTTPPCGWGTSPGETRSGVGWSITVKGDTISLDEDMRNWPTDDLLYSGHLDGAQFTASYTSASDYASYVCQFREASITGRFTSDSTFDAMETLVWGQPGAATTVVRRWSGTRL